MFLLVNGLTFSQADSTNVSECFDDGGLADRKNIVKVNFLPMINAEYSMQYERFLTDHFSIEIGAGKIFTNYKYEVFDPILSDQEIEELQGGYSFSIYPRFRAGSHKFVGVRHFGFQYRRKQYNLSDDTVIATDYTFVTGMQFEFAKHFVFEYFIGVGPRFRKDDTNNKHEMYTVAFPAGVKLGVIF